MSFPGFSFASSHVMVSLCRQFWKAGDYEAGQALESPFQSSQNHMRVHPKFLHSNATSHKWAFGAIAELLDNAVDEVQNGATFVIIDKITNPRDGNPALLIQDDGGGMDPESLRCCMSFGFSDKQSDSSIGQYGNGFKTSTMRLGADVIVFSRCMNKRTLTQSVGLLSYTFLRLTGSDDVIVPIVDYEFDPLTGIFTRSLRRGQKQFSSNLAMLLQWSPFATESEMLKQFNDIGHHGTKVIMFNLWFNDDGESELEFDSNPEDILISGAPQVMQINSGKKMSRSQMHVANQFRYSLRVYSSILYLHMPESFRIILRGQVVNPHQIASDLKYHECIEYKPHVEEDTKAVFTTIIGFLKDAPKVDIHGFNVYHKNRLILPFWRVVSNTRAKGRGVAGILEANFIKPTHDKQDFEKSTLYQKLEVRLRDMTSEYWDSHCHLVGYPANKKLCRFLPAPVAGCTDTMPPHSRTRNGLEQVTVNHHSSDPADQLSSCIGPVALNPGSLSISASGAAFGAGSSMDSEGYASCHISAGRHTALSAPPYSTPRQSAKHNALSQTGPPEKRRHENHFSEMEALKRQNMEVGTAAGLGSNPTTQLWHGDRGRRMQEIVTIMQEKKRLRAECQEHERAEIQLLAKVQKLKIEFEEVQQLSRNLLIELKSMDETKIEIL